MMVLENSIQEHQSCYSFAWCQTSEKDLPWQDRSVWVGSGRLLSSKDGRLFDFEGSAPGVDWVHQFELKVNGLEDYWYLAIPFQKKNISQLKTALKCSTSEILQLVTDNQTIVYTESKTWSDFHPSFQEMVEDLNAVGIICQTEIRTRKIDQLENV